MKYKMEIITKQTIIIFAINDEQAKVIIENELKDKKLLDNSTYEIVGRTKSSHCLKM